MKHMPAADGVTGDHRDNRFRTGAHLALEIEHVQAVHTVLILVSRIPADLLVTAGAKRLFAPARKNNDTVFLIGARVVKRARHFLDRLGPERVTRLWPIDRDLRDPIGFMVFDVRVFLARNPSDCILYFDSSCHYSFLINSVTATMPVSVTF